MITFVRPPRVASRHRNRLLAGLGACAGACVMALLAAAPADAGYPGKPGVIAFDSDLGVTDGEIFTMPFTNALGAPRTQLTFDVLGNVEDDDDPAYSGDGKRIVWEGTDGDDEIFVMNSDGSGQTQLTFNSGGAGDSEAEPAFSSIKGHLVYQRKEVGLIFLDGEQIGKPSCGGQHTRQTSRDTHEDVPQRGKWTLVDCTFGTVVAWDKTGEKRTPRPRETGQIHVLSDHPGDYEIKILERGRLARSLKFTVAEDGTIVDNGIAKANKLGSDKIIVPVKFTGTPDGVWNKLAWKTDAFFGNPLSGFTWIP